MNITYLKTFLYIVLFVSLYIVIQSIAYYIGVGIVAFLENTDYATTYNSFIKGQHPNALTVSLLLSTIITITLFTAMRWAVLSKNYLQSRPWGVFFWAFTLALGLILPAQYTYELMGIEMSEDKQEMLGKLMQAPWGYLAIGIIAPIGEEIIFRGAILRKLLEGFNQKYAWLAIVLSGVLFGIVHGNMAQAVHASLLGILLGWMYYRTQSILPGIVLHWVNNTVAYIGYHLFKNSQYEQLTDLLGDNPQTITAAIIFSLCIALPSLFQLYHRMKRA